MAALRFGRYVEEGLRMDEHPLIRFTDGQPVAEHGSW